MALRRMQLSDVSGSRKCQMVVVKPKIRVSQLVDKIYLNCKDNNHVFAEAQLNGTKECCPT